MFQVFYPLIRALEPFLVPICFCLSWGLVFLFVLTILKIVKESWANAKRMHQIPCSNCQFFTNDHRLKCTLHPSVANSEAAISCLDYAP